MYACKEFADNIINGIRGTQTTYTGKKYLALFTKNPTRNGGVNNGEATFTGYERKEITFAVDNTDSTKLKISNRAAITFSNSGNSQTIKYIVVYGNNNNVKNNFGTPILWGPLSTPLVLDGDVRFDIGSIVWEMSGLFGSNLRQSFTNVFTSTGTANLPNSRLSLFVALFSQDPSSVTAQQLTSIEVSRSGTGYARKQLVSEDFAPPADDDSGQSYTSLVNDITMITDSQADWGNISHIGIMSSSSSGYVYMTFPLQSDVTVSAGDSVRIPAGSLEFHVG